MTARKAHANGLRLRVKWEGPFTPAEVRARYVNGGSAPRWEGPDYGLYQIYGKHIVAGKTLIYVGKANRQTFSRRFKQHAKWLDGETGIEVYLGRIYDRKRHTSARQWKGWETDVYLAERLVIHKYSPNYNSSSIARPPVFAHKRVVLVHAGRRARLEPRDIAPDDLV